MSAFLFVLGIGAGIISAFSLIAAFGQGGSDLQIIASGVFGTMTAACFGFAAVLSKLEPKKDEQEIHV